MSTRVYVPSTLLLLREVVAASGIAPAPFVAHAVTAAVRRELDGLDEDDLEYAASSAAAQASVALLTDGEPARRLVLAVDVSDAHEAGLHDPTLVEVDEMVPFGDLAGVLADSATAEATVAAARDALGTTEEDRLLERCLDHELGWWAAQEIGDLLGSA